jgi:hypothetical protein
MSDRKFTAILTRDDKTSGTFIELPFDPKPETRARRIAKTLEMPAE